MELKKTLMSLYRPREANLKQQLDAAATVGDAVDLLLRELAWLEGMVSGDLTVPQQRAFQAMLEVVRSSLRGLKEGVRLQKTTLRRGALSQIWQVVLRMMGLSGGPSGTTQAAQAGGDWYRVQLDSAVCLSHFAAQLTVVDRWLQDQPVPTAWESPRDALEFVQRLTADARARDTELLYERLEQAPQVLERYGMRFVDYDPRLAPSSAEARRLFRFEPSLDPRQTTTETLAPAVVQGDEVVFRGLVVQPARIVQQ